MGFGLDIKKNDQVKVMAGRDKGKVGRVLEVEPRKRRLYVEHVNMITPHASQSGQANPGRGLGKGRTDPRFQRSLGVQRMRAYAHRASGNGWGQESAHLCEVREVFG